MAFSPPSGVSTIPEYYCWWIKGRSLQLFNLHPKPTPRSLKHALSKHLLQQPPRTPALALQLLQTSSSSFKSALLLLTVILDLHHRILRRIHCFQTLLQVLMIGSSKVSIQHSWRHWWVKVGCNWRTDSMMRSGISVRFHDHAYDYTISWHCMAFEPDGHIKSWKKVDDC